jgi:hypothetical protein
VTIQDCGSTNGTWAANGERITGPRPLVPSEPVRLGNCQLVLAEVTAHITTVPPISDERSALTTDTPQSPYRLPDGWLQRVRGQNRE